MIAPFKISVDEIRRLPYEKTSTITFLDLKPNIKGDAQGKIDGTKLQNAYFPIQSCDVFISHSHNDKPYALKLKAWLENECHLSCFMDSCVWGSADALLSDIDDVYCKIEGKNSFYYDRRNYSTSHVHVMLSIALLEAINQSKFFLFIESTKSLDVNDIKTKTLSPWLYEELAFANRIQREKLTRPRRRMFNEGGAVEQAQHLLINYNTDLADFASLDKEALCAMAGHSKSECYDYMIRKYKNQIMLCD